jgi:hypothetical protein
LKFLLRFHQLHISSIFEEDRRALIQPTGFEVYSDESDHKISPYVCLPFPPPHSSLLHIPQMCRRVYDNGKIVWANAKVCEGLVGQDVPLHTAVGIPVCRIEQDLCVIVLFSVSGVPMTPRAVQFLCAMKAALPYYEKLTHSLDESSNLLLQEFESLPENSDHTATQVDTITSVPSWINLAFQDTNELITCPDGSVNGLHSSWSYLRLSNLWNPTNETGAVLVDGKRSYLELKERFHELMIGLLHLTNFEITELWLVEEENQQLSNLNSSTPSNGKLSVVAAFHTDTSLQPWAAFTRLITLTIGLDFPGHVVQSGRPIADMTYGQHHIYDPLYPRALHAKELGLKTAFGVPLPRASGVCGTLVFYSRGEPKIHPKLVTMITASAYLLAGSWLKFQSLYGQNDIFERKPSSDGIAIVQEIIPPSADGEGDSSRNYEIESKTLIDFAFSNALEFLSENLDSWPDQGVLGFDDPTNQTALSDPLSTFPDAGRKRSRSVRSPRGSFGQLSDLFDDERCRRCNRPKDKAGYYCSDCDNASNFQMTSMSSSFMQPFPGQLGYQIPGLLDSKLPGGNFNMPRSPSSLFGMPPSSSTFMPQYCLPTNINEFQQPNYGQYQTPHRRPSAEIALAMSNDGFYMGETSLGEIPSHHYPHVQIHSEHLSPDHTSGNPNLNMFPQGTQYQSHDNQGSSTASSSSAQGNLKICKYRGCKSTTVQRSPYCAAHAGSRKCQHEGCNKCAQGATKLCIAHGGGRRCTFPGCTKGARDKFFCAAHGGGKRCEVEGCTKSAVGSSKFCTNHGGGKRCREPGCQKSAQSSTPYCVRHGGGRKCCVPGCSKVCLLFPSYLPLTHSSF